MTRKRLPYDVAKALRQKNIAQRCYLSHDDNCIYTSLGTIENWRERPTLAAVTINKTAGTNAGRTRTLAKALADHGIFYTIHEQANGLRKVALHGVKGFLGFYDAFAAWDLVHALEN